MQNIYQGKKGFRETAQHSPYWRERKATSFSFSLTLLSLAGVWRCGRMTTDLDMIKELIPARELGMANGAC